MEPIRYFTGLELVQLLKGKPIGVFDQHKIQADINALGPDSEMGIAKLQFQLWATECKIDVLSLPATSSAALSQALMWYAVFRYRRHDMEHMRAKSDCTEDHYRKLHYDKQRVCRALLDVQPGGICMRDRFLLEVERDAQKCDPGTLEEWFGDDTVIS